MRLSILVVRALCAVLLTALLSPLMSAAVFAQTPPPPVLARSWALVDVTSSQILASSRSEERVQPASLTKLMVAYLVFEALKDRKIAMNQIVIPSDIVTHVSRGESRMFIEPNKPVTVQDLVYGLIVQSGNDAALALAELMGGNEANFVAMMNRTAQKMGLKHTHYTDTNGMPDAQHYTTAGDLALLSLRLMRDFPEYYSIFSVKEFTYNKIRQFNRNRLLWIDSTVDGLKTGHTEAAGFCLIASAKRPIPNAPGVTRRLLTVMMGERREHDRVQDSLKMLNYGYYAYDAIRLYQARQTIDSLRVFKGAAKTVRVGAPSDQLVTVPKGMGNKLKPIIHPIHPLIAPLKRGQPAGVVSVMADNKQIAAFPIVVLEDVPQADILSRWWDAAVLMVQKKMKAKQ